MVFEGTGGGARDVWGLAGRGWARFAFDVALEEEGVGTGVTRPDEERFEDGGEGRFFVSTGVDLPSGFSAAVPSGSGGLFPPLPSFLLLLLLPSLTVEEDPCEDVDLTIPRKAGEALSIPPPD